MSNYAQITIDKLTERFAAERLECPPDLVPFYAVLVHVTGTTTSDADVHEGWAMWRLITKPDHPDLVLFDRLSPTVQSWDRPYRDAIRAVAAEISA